MTTSALGERRLVARAGLALVLANLRYWTSIAPVVRRELERWELRAQAIDDPELRALALEKLQGEGFHAEAAAMLATLSPRAHRSTVVEAIVALELLFDYLDGLTERPSAEPLGDGQRVFGALIRAVAVPHAVRGESLELPARSDDGGYLECLSRAVSGALARLPAALAIAEVAEPIATRSGQAQTRMHAVPALGNTQLEEWGVAEAVGTGLGWREFVAGSASSVLVLHALIAAASDPRTTCEDAERIAQAYLSMCVVLTLLDGLVDHEEDKGHDRSERPGYIGLFDRSEHPEQLASTMAAVARRAIAQARGLAGAAHHEMILTGVVAYYGSAPGAGSELARPVVSCLRRELAPLMAPTLAILRTWRSVRRPARLFRANAESESYHETSVERGTVGPPGCCG